MDAGIAGTDEYEFWIVPVTATEKELNDFAWERATNHADMYGIYPASEYAYEDIEADPDSYSHNIEGYVEDYNPEKHDMHTMTGTPHWSVY